MPFVHSGTCRNVVNERHGRAFARGRCTVLFLGWAAFRDASVLLGDTIGNTQLPHPLNAT